MTPYVDPAWTPLQIEAAIGGIVLWSADSVREAGG
jgi:hypothetical protein